jgi:hypothetical protein
MSGTDVDGSVTVSVIVRDARGFTSHYDDFVTDSAQAERALELLATAHQAFSAPHVSTPRAFFARALGALVKSVG